MPSSKPQARGRGYRWLVFALLAFGYLLVYFHRLCPAVVALDLMQDLSAGGALMGLLGSAYFYPYAFMQLPAGLLSDSWGPRRSISLFFCIAGIASILFGLTQSAAQAIGARFLVGIGISMLFVPTMKVLTRWFKTSEFALMTGLLMAVGGIGVYTASRPLAYLSELLGWRGSFVAIGVVTLLLAGAIWIFVRNTPQELGLPPAEELPASKEPQAPAIGLWQGIKMVLGTARFWPLAIWFFFACGIFFSFGGLWGGPYLMQIHGLSRAEAGNVLSMLAVAMIVGSPLLSYISDRVLYSRKKMLIITSSMLLVLTIPLALFPAGLSIPFLYLWCLLMSFSASAIVVIAFTSAKELFPVAIAGTSVGLVNLFPFLGGAVMQPVLGIILEAHGQGPQGYSAEAYGQAFMVYCFAALAALIASLFAKDTLSRPQKSNS